MYGISGEVSVEIRQVIVIGIAIIGNVIILFEDRFYVRLSPPSKEQLLKKARSRQVKERPSQQEVSMMVLASAAAPHAPLSSPETSPPASSITLIDPPPA